MVEEVWLYGRGGVVGQGGVIMWSRRCGVTVKKVW